MKNNGVKTIALNPKYCSEDSLGVHDRLGVVTRWMTEEEQEQEDSIFILIEEEIEELGKNING